MQLVIIGKAMYIIRFNCFLLVDSGKQSPLVSLLLITIISFSMIYEMMPTQLLFFFAVSPLFPFYIFCSCFVIERNLYLYSCRNGLSTDGKKVSFAEMMTDDVQTCRQERCFRLWINSLGIVSYVNNVFEDVRNG